MLSGGRDLQIVPSHGCAAPTQPARHVASPSPTSVWETALLVRNMGPRVRIGMVVQTPRLWNVLNVVTPEQTTAPGVRAAEGSLSNALRVRPTTATSRNKQPEFLLPTSLDATPSTLCYTESTLREYHTVSATLFQLPTVSCWGTFLNFPCIQILYIFSCRLRFTSKRLSGASKTISNNG